MNCASPYASTPPSSLPIARWKRSATTPTGHRPSLANAAQYSSFKGSLGDRGILPLDSLRLLAQARGHVEYTPVRPPTGMPCARERKRAMACNPTAWPSRPPPPSPTSLGVDASSNPRSATSRSNPTCPANSPVINQGTWCATSKTLGLWDDVMVNDPKHFDGSLHPIDRILQTSRDPYATAFEVENLAGGRCQPPPEVDRPGAEPEPVHGGASRKKLTTPYKLAWYRGLKPPYHRRALAATHRGNTPSTHVKLNAVSSGGSTRATAHAGPVPAVPKVCPSTTLTAKPAVAATEQRPTHSQADEWPGEAKRQSHSGP